MEWSKLKNVILLILLVANLFLLALVINQTYTSSKLEKQAVQNMIAVLEQNGIVVDESVLPSETALTFQSVAREISLEETIASHLLGEYLVSDLSAGRYAYESEAGRGEFRNNGNFSFSIEEGTLVDEEGDSASYAAQLLEDMGLDVLLLSQSEDGESETLIFRQVWNGYEILTCQITAEFQNDSLVSLSGDRLMGTPYKAEEQEELLTLSTVLMRFLHGINQQVMYVARLRK